MTDVTASGMRGRRGGPDELSGPGPGIGVPQSRPPSLRAQHAQQTVLLVVDTGSEPERTRAAGRRRPGQQRPQAGLGETLAGGGVAELAGSCAPTPAAP